MIAHKMINVKYLSTKEIMIDALTKPLNKDLFVRHVKSFLGSV